MTVRHVRFETSCLGHSWHDVADLDDADPLIAALLAASRLTVVPGTPGPAQSYHPTAVLYNVTAPDVTGLAAGTVWVSPAGFELLEDGGWVPLAGGGGAAAPTTDAARESYVPARLSDASLKAAYAAVADVIAAEQNLLVGVQSAEQRNLAAGTTVAAWSAADAASAITSAVNIDSVLDPFGSPSINPVFRYLRGNPAVRQPGVYPGQTVTKMTGLTSDATELLPYVLFNHEGATKIEVRIFGQGSYQTLLRVSVDGAWANYTQLTGPAQDGALHRCLITLPDASKHEIGLEFGGFSAWWAGLTVDPAAKVTRVIRNIGPRLIIMGDSETEGANGQPNTIGNKLGFAPELGRLLGLADTWQSGLGDTGYIGTSGGTRATIGQRLQADAISQNPDWVHLAAGQVDAGLGTPPTYAQELAAVGSVLDALKSGLPNAQITAQSPWRPFDSVSGAPAIVVRNAIRDACKARGIPFYDVSQLVTGTGHIGATTGNGTADTYVGADGVHLSDLGHKVAGRYIAAMIRRSLSLPGVPG